MDKICQSCGMKMVNKGDFGTNEDGSIQEEYCTYCFQKGDFTQNRTMEEQIEKNLEFLDEFNKDTNANFSKEQAREEMLQYFPTLKRWKNEILQDKVIKKLEELEIPEFKDIKEMCELPGAYVNMESELPNGEKKKVLQDDAMYLCCQAPINDLECYGVAANEERIVIYRYKNDDSESKIIQIIEL